MARMPGAVWQGEKSPRRTMSRYDAVCIHTIVGYAPAPAAHFSVKADGTIIQSRDTRYRSAANLNGNDRIIAIENEDHGPAFGKWNVNDGHDVPDFTAAQIEANAKILAWAHKTHGIPLQLCPNSRPTSRGLAFHRQGIDGNWAGYRYSGRVSGGETWSSSRGKVCPGDRRIARRQQILTRARQIVNGDDDVADNDNIFKAPDTWYGSIFQKASNPKQRMRAYSYLTYIHKYVIEARAALTKTIPFNSWMEKRWGAAGYSLRTYVRTGYGHSRRSAEEIEKLATVIHQSVIPLLREIAKGARLTDEQIEQIGRAAADAVPEGVAVDVVDELVERLDDGDPAEPGYA